jgi:hypothetical protein
MRCDLQAANLFLLEGKNLFYLSCHHHAPEHPVVTDDLIMTDVKIDVS